MQIGSTNTSTINIGVSGDTVNIPAGVTIANAGTATGFGVAGTNAFLAFANGSTSVSDNVETKVAFDQEKYDVDGTYDHSTNYRFVAPVDGKYFFYYQVYANGQDNEQLRDTYGQFRVNGTAQSQTRELQNNNPSYLRMVNASAVLDLSASDYVEVYILIESVNNTQRYDGDTTQLRTYFGGFRLT
jgi:hypothetical protein